jgi:hypothetical protein
VANGWNVIISCHNSYIPFFGHIILKVEGAFGQRGIRLFEKLITNNDSLRMKKKCFWPEFGQNALKAFYQK